jgi:2-phosphoglycerate kinase
LKRTCCNIKKVSFRIGVNFSSGIISKTIYPTLSNSLYQSKYTAVDGKERNTRFNRNYIVTLITGKDFVFERKAKAIGVNIKTIICRTLHISGSGKVKPF